MFLRPVRLNDMTIYQLIMEGNIIGTITVKNNKVKEFERAFFRPQIIVHQAIELLGEFIEANDDEGTCVICGRDDHEADCIIPDFLLTISDLRSLDADWIDRV